MVAEGPFIKISGSEILFLLTYGGTETYINEASLAISLS